MKKLILTTAFIFVGAMPVLAGPLTIPHEFESGTPARASEVNANFDAVKAEVDDNSSRIDSKQNRVTGLCAPGGAIRSIAEDGSVECQSSAVATVPYRIFLQDGLDGYAGTSDTSLYKVPIAFNPEPGSFTQLYSEYQADETTGMLALIRFDMSSVISNAESFLQQFNSGYSVADCTSQITVNNAQLQVFGIGGGGSAGNTPAFLLRYFHETAPLFVELAADWDNANPSEVWDKSGTAVESFNDLIGGIFEAKDMPTSSYGRMYVFNVVPDKVKSWICDSSTNKGMAIEVAGGGSGGSMRFFSKEVALSYNRPKLIVDLKLN